MTGKKHETKRLDESKDGPRPSFITGSTRRADGAAHGDRMKDPPGRLKHSRETRRGYRKGGAVGDLGVWWRPEFPEPLHPESCLI